MRSTAEVLDHHLKCFAARDMDGVLADYLADALFFGPEGALRGPNAIKPVFEKMFAEFAKPGASVARKQRLIEGEYAYIVWTSETADNSYELASDTLVIQDGSIRLQAFTAKIKPKPASMTRLASNELRAIDWSKCATAGPTCRARKWHQPASV